MAEAFGAARKIERPERAPRSAASRRPGTMLLLVGLAALLLLVGCAREARAAQPAEVTGSIAHGFARLIFTLPEDVEADVRAAGGVVMIGFGRPVDIVVDHLAAAAPGYIGIARSDPDGRGVRIGLARKVTVNAMKAAEKLFVDLLPEGWVGLPPGLPQEVVDDLVRRAREAERKLRKQQPAAANGQPAKPVRLRVAKLPTFVRYVFEPPPATAVAVDRTKDGLNLTFDAPLKFDLADARASLPPVVASIDADSGSETATVRFVFLGKADVRTFREDAAFVVDVSASDAQAGAAAGGASDTGDLSERGWMPPGGSRPAPARARPQHASAPPAEKPAGSAPPASEAAQPAPPPEKAASPAPAAPHPPPASRTAKEQPPAQAAGASEGPAAQPGAPVEVQVRRQEDTVRLVFPFQEKTSGAVFQRGDTMWLVFDSAAPLDLARLKDDRHRPFRDIAVQRSGQGQAVRLKLERQRLASAAADGHTWIVTLAETAHEPTAPLAIVRAKSAAGHPVVLIPFEDAQQVHRFGGAESGGELLVVTAFAPARGFRKGQELVEFRVLPSTHGVAVEPVADDIAVEAAPGQIVVSRPRGLALTEGADGSGRGLATYRPIVLDVRSWAADRQADFLDRQAALMAALADAPESERTVARLDVARFYLARDMNGEAKGALDVAIADERDNHRLAAALVLRAIANLMLGRPDLALHDLSAGAVGNQHAAPLWRGVALSRDGRFTDARSAFGKAQVTSAELPAELQRVILREAARCALEVGDLSEAAHRLNELETIGIPFELRAAASILAGRLAESFERPDDALAAYRAAAESADQPAAAQGRLRLLRLRQALRQIARDEAIAELETLTAAWRGDETEAEALQVLARLYADAGRYRDALQVMRVALIAHPRLQATSRIQEEAAATFEAIFLGDRGNSLSPVEALGLFYDFRALTPPGRRGDEMIRRLAERLAAVDLLPQAGDLLQHQIDHRVRGAARAQVAARLAMLYLMDRKPDRALQALRATRTGDLPNELRRQRLLLEARALSDSGRQDLALDIIEDLADREAVRLRADIHWSARHWRESAEAIEQLYGERWKEAAPLDASERADVLRAAIGYALAEDALGLDRFREKYAAKMAEGADARMFEVVAAPLNAQAAEFAEIARAAAAIDTLSGFLRALRERYPDAAPAVSAAPQAGRG